jgi:ABC-2 type transport system ATP-binding protein
MSNRPVIELEGFQVALGGRPILKGLTCALHGRCIGLLGPNGAGKSTLINALLGFHAPSSGTARLFGRDIRTELNVLRHRVGYMPESDSFIGDMTGVQFVRYMAELAGLPSRQALERAHEAFFYVGLGEARYRKVGTYSLGMKQMAKLAQAIAHGPRLLFLDEPTNGLDPPGRLRMLRLIREIRDTEGMHIVLSSHLLRDVEECCDEVFILKDGRVAAQTDLAAERAANRKFLELEIAGPAASLPEAFRTLGCECALFGNMRLKLVLPDEIDIRQLYAIAAEKGTQIRRMTYRRDSLEDIFLNAMENGGAQASASAGLQPASSGGSYGRL